MPADVTPQNELEREWSQLWRDLAGGKKPPTYHELVALVRLMRLQGDSTGYAYELTERQSEILDMVVVDAR